MEVQSLALKRANGYIQYGLKLKAEKKNLIPTRSVSDFQHVTYYGKDGATSTDPGHDLEQLQVLDLHWRS